MERNWKTIIGILTLIWVFSMLISSTVNIPGINADVAVIKICGPIGGTSSIYSTNVNADTIISELSKANNLPNIKYIILDINSPGGLPVDSERIADKVASLNKTVIAVIEDIGTSGAYWVASSANLIFASKVSIVGSVGVYGSYLDISGLLNKYGVSYNQLTAGKYKDIGSPFRNMTSEEKQIYEERLKLMDQYFLEQVSTKRNLTPSEKENISTALFYTGDQALRLHLIDKIGTYETALSYIKEKINRTPTVYVFQDNKGFLNKLSEMISRNNFLLGYGIGQGLRVDYNWNKIIS